MSGTNFGLESIKPIDNIDDRREILVLVQKLTQEERLQFLRWCVAHVNGVLQHDPQNGVTIYIKHETQGHPRETVLDIMQLVIHYGLPLDVALAELTARARAILLPGGEYSAI